jgi:hypothetical protein
LAWDAGCLVAQDLALLTKVRTRIHEEISLLTVLYFPFRARTPCTLFSGRFLKFKTTDFSDYFRNRRG